MLLTACNPCDLKPPFPRRCPLSHPVISNDLSNSPPAGCYPSLACRFFNRAVSEPLQARQVPDNHVIGAGDELVVHIYGTVNFTGRLIVDRSGQIFIPKVGPVSVAGLRFRDAEAQLNRSIGEVYRNFRLSVSMGRLRSIEIYILGQARSPGRKVVSSLSTLINALFETGVRQRAAPCGRSSFAGQAR